ncbi:sugar transferase [Sphingobium sp.]|uniref:sugar transferase n=1 Tax=Sphingobium sp. TaxID=1912891 RepID=UPI002C1AAEE4|nr:sugar transferase [Sphingobium sp.]HUD91507.1 sugar transferase [Sphingobium sp.]
MKVLVLASLAYSLVNFRGALLRRMVAEGHEVVACAPDDDPVTSGELERMGIAYRRVPMDRIGTNPLRDVGTLWAMWRIIRSEAPDVILAYTQKPIIYGGMAARIAAPRARYFAMVSGLGHVYSDDEPASGKRRFLRPLISVFYRMAIARAAGIFVFNADDEAEMRRHAILSPRQRAVQVPGSGIDTDQFTQQPIPDGAPTFLLVARLMRNKGIGEFVEAAAMVRKQYPDTRFQILGPQEPGKAGFGVEEMATWQAKGVDYLGATRDVRPHLAAASVFVLPTFYREGLPRTILEAMAIGRPIITTDTPGCRETVLLGENGLLVPPRDADALASAMARLAANPDRIIAMGARSRRLAEDHYHVEKVNSQLLSEMGLLGPSLPSPVRRTEGRALGDYPAVERTLAVLALIPMLPVMLLLAGGVALALGRPVLFRQRRAGLGGRVFDLVKFRSMRDLRDAHGQPLADEARLTAFGRLLRRSRLDELPELWNIARGEMSFVGPRPLLPATVDAMGEKGRQRGSVRPGLTGWAQVNGNALLSDADKLALDLWYVEHRSFGRDLWIALRTVETVFGGERISQMHIRRAYASVADRRG